MYTILQNNCQNTHNKMDSTDIPLEVFTCIFLQPNKVTKDIIKQISEWNESFDPSFNIVKAQFKKFIQKNPNNPQALCSNVIQTLQILSEYKCPRNFVRGFLATIKSILEGQQSAAKKLLESNQEVYKKKWQEINVEVLEPYFEAFSLKGKISQEEINEFIEKMINTKKYNNCLDFIKFLGVNQNKENIDKLMAKMSNKRDASKAADYVKRLKLDPKSYPALGERLYKNTARHFLTKHGWQYAEEIFEEYPQALACVVEDLIYKNKIAEARSIWQRHPLWEYLQKEESKQVLKQQFEGEITANSIMCNDIFDCPDRQKYLSLSDFGIREQDIIWVDQSTPQLKQILEDIESAELLGIDTESIVGQTKFQKVDEAAVIQVSTGKKIYVFDGFKSNNQSICQTFKKCFQGSLIIGHSFTNDTQGMFKGFGLPANQQIRIKNLIDICKVYKGLYQNSKYSSLAHICKQVFGKQLCKDQTLTNWKRRPLRKNQLHYAALDAHVVIEVYKVWLKEYGNIVHFHAKMDIDDM